MGDDVGRGRAAVGWTLVVVQAGLLAALVLLPWGTGWPRSWFTWLAGAALVVAGGLAAMSAMRGLGRALTPTPVPVDGAALRTDGAYARVRHPIYSGLLLAGLGWTVWAASWAHVVAWGGLLVLFTVKASWEERMLRQRYPDYADYADAVPRFLPRARGGSR